MTLPKITHPLFDLEIPSTKKKIKARPMLVKEEKILLIAKTANQYKDIQNAVKQVVNNCIADKDVDVNKLTIFDLEFLFLKLRAFSVNNTAKVSYRDNEDTESYDFEVDLDKLVVKFPENINKVVRLNDEYSLLLKYPEASLYSEKDYKGDGPEDIELLVTKTIDKLIKGDEMIEPAFETKQAIVDFVENLPVKTYQEIQEFWKNMPTLYYELNYTNKMGKERKIVLSTLEDFFTFV